MKFHMLSYFYETDLNPTLKCQDRRPYYACNRSGRKWLLYPSLLKTFSSSSVVKNCKRKARVYRTLATIFLKYTVLEMEEIWIRLMLYGSCKLDCNRQDHFMAVPCLRQLVNGWSATSKKLVQVFLRVLKFTSYRIFNQSSKYVHLFLHKAVYAAGIIINWNT